MKRYTSVAYWRIRRHCPAERVAVVFHDGFRSFREYAGFLQSPEHDNVIFDVHRYQCFVQDDIDRDIYRHLQKVVCDWKHEADEIIGGLGLPTYVGEWSLGLDAKLATLWADGPFDHLQTQMDDFQFDIACRGYAAAQLAVFEKYLGWFFWSYKTENMPQWNFRECIERGWLPGKFA